MIFSLPFALALAASVSTYVGGMLTIRFARHRELIFGLTGGLVIGLALFDLLPEALETGKSLYGMPAIIAVSATGMGLYFLLSRLPAAGVIGRLTLLVHSFVDGLGIGLAFQVSASTGWLVAVAILAHKLADGANMVGITLVSADLRRAHTWLVANALVPLAGVMLGQLVGISAGHFALILALFAGGFLFIGVAELLPRSRTRSQWRSMVATIAGLMIMASVVHFAG